MPAILLREIFMSSCVLAKAAVRLGPEEELEYSYENTDVMGQHAVMHGRIYPC